MQTVNDIKTNIKVNYMILEHVLRVMKYYQLVCDEYDFLTEIFRRAREGCIDSAEDIKGTVISTVTSLTGLKETYWEGSKRMSLGIRCTCPNLQYDDFTIDNIHLENDTPFMVNRLINNEDVILQQYSNWGTGYKELLDNPLHIDHDELVKLVCKNEDITDEDKVDEVSKLYSLNGLLSVILLNMSDSEIPASDRIYLKNNVSIYHKLKWELFIKSSNKQTSISYCPKYLEIRKGCVQTLIKKLNKLYDFPKY